MNTTTIADFAKEKKMPAITLYKQIENSGIEPVGKIQGVKKPFNLYDKDVLERLILKRNCGRPKTPKQKTFNTAKLW